MQHSMMVLHDVMTVQTLAVIYDTKTQARDVWYTADSLTAHAIMLRTTDHHLGLQDCSACAELSPVLNSSSKLAWKVLRMSSMGLASKLALM